MSSSIVWPLVSNMIRGRSVNNTFGMVRKHANGGMKPHQGWDLEASVGDPVYLLSMMCSMSTARLNASPKHRLCGRTARVTSRSVSRAT
jgi:hypothetical protein